VACLAEREGGVVDDVARGAAARSPAASFDAYVAEYRTALVRYATFLCGSAAQAEDLVQDVLVRLYPRWGTLADPHPYVRRSVTNEFLSWRRRWATRHVHALPDTALTGEADRRAHLDWNDEPGADPELWSQLGRLPRQQRAAVVLRYWEGLSDADIGDVLDCRPGTVRAHVSRGLATLRAGLEGRQR
jgi:RNA polymerase sigma-70 factor (sigma-E family)